MVVFDQARAIRAIVMKKAYEAQNQVAQHRIGDRL